MPVYNEKRTIAQAIDEVLSAEYPCDVELTMVDDGSSDGAATLLDNEHDPRVRVHCHPVNRGKGAAVLSAAASVTGTHALLLDADLEYSPDGISSMLAPVRKGRCRIMEPEAPWMSHVTALKVNCHGNKVSVPATG